MTLYLSLLDGLSSGGAQESTARVLNEMVRTAGEIQAVSMLMDGDH